MVREILKIARESGLAGLWRKGVSVLYKRGIRPFLPSLERFEYAGIPVAVERKWGDEHVPATWIPEGLEDKPRYEARLVAGLRAHVRPGDEVVIVGGGVGATAAIAAMLTGPGGRVTCFEAGGRGVRSVRRTARLNGVEDRLLVRHATVARGVSVYGLQLRRKVVPPEALPPCDVLELDCEGAEIDILRGMGIRPRVILVESHGIYGAPTAAVVDVLEQIGYETTDLGTAEPDLAEVCDEADIHVVLAVVSSVLPSART